MCIADAASDILGLLAAQQLKQIPLLDSIIERRIAEIAADIEEQVIACMMKLWFSAIQLTGPTEIHLCNFALLRKI